VIARVYPASSQSQTWAFDGAAWQRLFVDPATLSPATGFAFDPERGVVIMRTNDASYALGDTGWTPLVPNLTAAAFGPLAYDVRNHCLIGPGQGGVEELCTAQTLWSPILASGMGSSYLLVANAQRGSVFMIDRFANSVTWERTEKLWMQLPPPPLRSAGLALAYDPVRAEVMTFDGDGRVLALGYRNAHPLETCVAGSDTDGDRATGCADGDCWWQCTPECPPFASCP
jgi:hypothetical protein